MTVQDRLISLAGRVFASGPEDLGSIPGRVIPKALKMVLDTSLLNTQYHKGKGVQSRGNLHTSTRVSLESESWGGGGGTFLI